MQDSAWLHTLNPVILPITQSLGVRWYGLAYVAAFLVGWLLLRVMAKRGLLRMTPEQVTDSIFALVLGVFVGGRLGYAIFYKPSLFITFTSNPPWWGLLAINEGGMASHGGMIGVIVASVWVARRTGAPSLHILDAVTLVAPIGLFFGRLANFINGELLGRAVAAPGEPGPWWSVRFPQELLTRHRPTLDGEQSEKLYLLFDRVAPGWEALGDDGYEEAAARLISAVQRGSAGLARELEPLLSARHPSQLYQALAEGPILLATLWFAWRKSRTPGVVGAWFLMGYGVLRIVTEFWRLPDDQLAVARILGLSRGQWLSVLMVAAGAIGLRLVTRRRSGAPARGAP